MITALLIIYHIWIPVAPVEHHKVQNEPNIAVLEILDKKCNSCHAEKKKSSPIFTLENMESEKLRINYQVFVKKRMPKGKKHDLTSEERALLLKWIKG